MHSKRNERLGWINSAFEGLELYAGKLAFTVLRRERAVRPCPIRCIKTHLHGIRECVSLNA